MKKHPEIGFRIAQNNPEMVSIADYILSHHERWDVPGYPRGLKGEEIPLPARLFAVVDAFDAMTSDRPLAKNTIKS
ncbi:HD-GYP domain-containing protein [Carboxydothermus pertinax]|uniref:Diguanylate cyclase n=1 Tax=Carboxydothermus pertinax TaxID=870242 RepID=A0A1L8CW52_9THEO|nr:HD domain-containing phosphohydrolase [Carboxydothermus pertinax]GAV23148.1 diguanylate cyclase [Carboxydothermus pertinax]